MSDVPPDARRPDDVAGADDDALADAILATFTSSIPVQTARALSQPGSELDDEELPASAAPAEPAVQDDSVAAPEQPSAPEPATGPEPATDSDPAPDASSASEPDPGTDHKPSTDPEPADDPEPTVDATPVAVPDTIERPDSASETEATAAAAPFAEPEPSSAAERAARPDAAADLTPEFEPGVPSEPDSASSAFAPESRTAPDSPDSPDVETPASPEPVPAAAAPWEAFGAPSGDPVDSLGADSPDVAADTPDPVLRPEPSDPVDTDRPWEFSPPPMPPFVSSAQSEPDENDSVWDLDAPLAPQTPAIDESTIWDLGEPLAPPAAEVPPAVEPTLDSPFSFGGSATIVADELGAPSFDAGAPDPGSRVDDVESAASGFDAAAPWTSFPPPSLDETEEEAPTSTSDAARDDGTASSDAESLSSDVTVEANAADAWQPTAWEPSPWTAEPAEPVTADEPVPEPPTSDTSGEDRPPSDEPVTTSPYDDATTGTTWEAFERFQRETREPADDAEGPDATRPAAHAAQEPASDLGAEAESENPASFLADAPPPDPSYVVDLDAFDQSLPSTAAEDDLSATPSAEPFTSAPSADTFAPESFSAQPLAPEPVAPEPGAPEPVAAEPVTADPFAAGPAAAEQFETASGALPASGEPESAATTSEELVDDASGPAEPAGWDSFPPPAYTPPPLVEPPARDDSDLTPAPGGFGDLFPAPATPTADASEADGRRADAEVVDAASADAVSADATSSDAADAASADSGAAAPGMFASSEQGADGDAGEAGPTAWHVDEPVSAGLDAAPGELPPAADHPTTDLPAWSLPPDPTLPSSVPETEQTAWAPPSEPSSDDAPAAAEAPADEAPIASSAPDLSSFPPPVGFPDGAVPLPPPPAYLAAQEADAAAEATPVLDAAPPAAPGTTPSTMSVDELDDLFARPSAGIDQDVADPPSSAAASVAAPDAVVSPTGNPTPSADQLPLGSTGDSSYSDDDDGSIDETDRAQPLLLPPTFPAAVDGEALLPPVVAPAPFPVLPPFPGGPVTAPDAAAATGTTAAVDARLPKTFEVEAVGTEPTPLDRRAGRAARLFWLWFAAHASVISLGTGAVLFTLGMSLRQAIVAAVAGVALSFLPIGIGTLAGKWSGQPTLVVSRASFGHVGNILPSLIAVLARAFWGGALLWIIGTAFSAMLDQLAVGASLGQSTLTMVGLGIGALLVALVAVIGYGFVARVQLVLSIVTGILVVGVIVITAPLLDIEAALTVSDGPWILVLTGAVIVFSYVGLAAVHSAGDVARYQSPGSRGSSNVLWASFGSTLPAVALVVWGALLAASDANFAAELASSPVDALAGVLPLWYPVPLLLAVALGALSGSVLSVYSGGFALQSLGLAVPRSVATLLAAFLAVAVGAGLVVLGTDATDLVRDLATTVAVPVAAWTGIFAAEMMIRRRVFDSGSLVDRGGIYPDLRVVNFLALILISVIGFGLSASTVAGLDWQGFLFPLLGIADSNALATSDVGVLIALVLGLLVPLVTAIPTIRKQEAASDAQRDAGTASSETAAFLD